MKNYRKFRDEIIEFPEGIIGIIGPNGVGKSSILEAIGWILYGNAMARTDKIEVKSQNASEDESCKAELVFDFGDRSYKIVRELKGKNAVSNALAYIDGNEDPVAERDSGVNQYIESLLGMDYVTFLRTVYAKQKDLAALSILPPEARKKVIRRMLNIDRIDLAITQIRSDKREKEKFIEGIQTSLEDLDKLEQAKGDIINQQKNINKDISNHTLVLKSITEDREKIKKDKDNQEQKYKIFNALNKDFSRFETQKSAQDRKLKDLFKELEELKQKKESLEKIEPKEEEYLKTKKEKEGQETLRLQYQEKISLRKNIKENKDDMEERQNKLKISIEQFKEFAGVQEDSDKTEEVIREQEMIRRKLEKVAKEIEGEVRICSSKIEELLSRKRKIAQLGKSGKCPTCFRELGDNYEDIVEHLDKEINNIKERLNPIQEKRDKLNKQLDEVVEDIDKLVEKKNRLNEKLKRKSKIEQSLEEQNAEIKKLKIKLEKEEEKLKGMKDIKFDQDAYEKLSEKFDALSKIRDTILELRKEVQRISKIDDTIDTSKKEIQQLDSQIKQVKEELKKLDFDEKKYEKVKASYEAINDKLIEVQNKLNDSKSQLAVSKQKSVNLEEKIDRQKESRKKIEETRAELRYLQRLESLLETFRLELTGRIRPLLETRASYLFSEITDGRYPSIELDEDYEMSILDGDKAFKLRRFSGGEEDLANLCLRIAMSQVIAERSGGIEINFIALDEIFGSQDEDRRQNILSSLNKLSSQFRQIFLITHIEDIKDMLSRVLQVEENAVTKESRVSL